eukprot:scaffold5109_cov112-Isochrysis_galbana.AAC.4
MPPRALPTAQFELVLPMHAGGSERAGATIGRGPCRRRATKQPRSDHLCAPCPHRSCLCGTAGARAVQNLLNQMQGRFATMSDAIIGRSEHRPHPRELYAGTGAWKLP